MNRLVALLVAIVLVVGALWIHGDLDGGGGDGGANGSDDGRPLRLLCASELGDVCDRLGTAGDLEVIVEPSSASVSELAVITDADARDPGFDGWLVPSPAAEIVIDRRERAQLEPVLDDDLRTVADSRLVLAIWESRRTVLADQCGKVDWRCIGDVAGRPWTDIGGEQAWGTVKPGHDNPELTALGLDAIGQAAAEYFGTPDLSTVDYEDGGFLGWFSRLENAVRFTSGNTPLGQMLAAGPAAYDAVGTVDAQARPLLAAASPDRRRNVALTYPAPVARVDLVYAPVTGSERADDLRDLLDDQGRDALERAGWDVERAGRSPRHENLPDPGSLQALLETWQEVTN